VEVTGLSIDQIMMLTEVLCLLLGIGVIWAVYHGSDEAELPGEATVPPPGEVDDAVPDTRGRTLG
jgi:hypothetical protein